MPLDDAGGDVGQVISENSASTTIPNTGFSPSGVAP